MTTRTGILSDVAARFILAEHSVDKNGSLSVRMRLRWLYYPLTCLNILKLIVHPNHGDMLRERVCFGAGDPFNQKKCLSLVLFSLRKELQHFTLFLDASIASLKETV